MNDMKNNIKALAVLLPAVTTTGGGARVASDIDLKGYDGASVIVEFGAPGDTLSGSVKYDVSMQHADDDGTGVAGAYADVADADVIGVTGVTSGIVRTVDADAEASQAYQIGYRGNARFLKVTVTPSSGHTTGTPISAIVLKGHPQIAPVS